MHKHEKCFGNKPYSVNLDKYLALAGGRPINLLSTERHYYTDAVQKYI